MTGRPRDRASSQRWSTFVRNHAEATRACDFFVTITVAFHTVSVFVVLDVGTRRIVHGNVTEHPTAAWTSSSSAPLCPAISPSDF
jgi:putative transposase